jgi:hypothetical protein
MTTEELRDKLVSELREIAEAQGLKNVRSLKKDELIQRLIAGSTTSELASAEPTPVDPATLREPRRRTANAR